MIGDSPSGVELERFGCEPSGPMTREWLMLVTLSIVFCLAVNPTHCQKVFPEPSETADLGLSNCAIRGQQLAAQWLGEHPKWMLDRVRCTIGNAPREDDI